MSSELTDEELVAALKDVLKQKGVSLRQISQDLEIPYRSVQNYLGGETRIPASIFLRICNYLGIESDYFIYKDFRPQASELFDAVYYALDRVGLLPTPNSETDHTNRKIFVASLTTAIADHYDRFRLKWLSRKDGGDALNERKRRRGFFEGGT
ncbi:helix-turn-helix domain-containing protein [Microvirga sp. 2MCAF35]|uniref:helix-turn-helix domain-containing protein n=1 Tax=Microvirga sp. 2MCAF35 TaxID=3232987 RepID=UPI003F946309